MAESRRSAKRQRQRYNRLANLPVNVVVCARPADRIDQALPLIKSALLYGDHVHLHSPLATMLSYMHQLGHGPRGHLVDTILELSKTANAGFSTESFAQMNALIEQYGEAAVRGFLIGSVDPHSIERVRLQQYGNDTTGLEDFASTFGEIQQSIGEQAQRSLHEAGFSPLARAFEQELITVLPSVYDAELTNYLDEIVSMLESPDLYVLLDDQLVGLVAQAVDLRSTGFRGLSRATNIGTAHFLLGQLPTFPDAGIDELIDLRARLEAPRVHFRSQMIRATADLKLTVTDSEFTEAAVELWYRDVAPALLNINEEIRDTGFARSHVGTAKRAAVGVGSALAIGFTSHEWTAASMVGVLTSAAAVSLDRGEARGKRRRLIRQNPYYFLHVVNSAAS